MAKVFDKTDVIPGTTSNFEAFAFPKIDKDGNIWFLGGIPSNFGFFHVNAAGITHSIVDTQTPFPDSANNFNSFGIMEFDGDKAVFLANDTGPSDPQSLVYFDGAQFEVLLSPGDTLDGQVITFIASPGRFDNGIFHVNIRFDDNSIAAYQFDYSTPTPQVVVPNSAMVDRGELRGGSVADLFESDDVDMLLSRDAAFIFPVIEMTIKGVGPIASPTSLSFSVEAAAFARGTINQEIEMFNYVTSSYEVVDMRPAGRFIDQVTTIEPTGDLTRFVEPGTGCLDARVRYTATMNRAQFSVNIDQIIWEVGE